MAAPLPRTNPTADAVLQRLVALLPAQRPLALHEPLLGGLEEQYTSDCLRSGWISSAGPFVDRFEQELADYTGIAHAVATVNGTSALHTCLMLAGVQAGDEVIAPALTFVGTLNPIAYQHAVPHLVDCEADTLGIDPLKLEAHLARIAELRDGVCFNRETGRPIRALVVVHVLGIPAQMDALAALAERWHIELIEDAAEALGSWRDQRHAGSWSRLAALSFNGNKIISSGGGGALLTGDAQLAQQARHLSTTAKLPHAWAFEHDRVGFNYRLPNVNAALGCAQLQRLDGHLQSKRRLFAHYRDGLGDLDGCEFHQPPGDTRSNHWLNLLLMPDRAQRDALLQAAKDEGLLLRPLWNPMQSLPMFADCPRAELPVTQDIWQRGVNLPSSPGLA